MPLYEYYCPPCGSQFEILRPLSQIDDPAVCPSGHTTNNRVLSLFAPVIKSTHSNVATALSDQAMTATDACCSLDDGCSCC